MLVLFKANTLMELSRIDSEIDNSSEDVVTDDNNTESPTIERLQLEKQLRRRTAAMPPPKRRVTLAELIEQLQIMASQLKEVEKPDKCERPRRQPSMKTMKAALELAHQENLTQVAVEVEQVLVLAAKEENSSEPSWGLEELVELWSSTKQANQLDQHGNLVSVFWALLLLCAQSKVELFQEEFYQEVKVRLSGHRCSN
jgi:segregation and condensation protein A